MIIYRYLACKSRVNDLTNFCWHSHKTKQNMQYYYCTRYCIYIWVFARPRHSSGETYLDRVPYPCSNRTLINSLLTHPLCLYPRSLRVCQSDWHTTQWWSNKSSIKTIWVLRQYLSSTRKRWFPHSGNILVIDNNTSNWR